MPKVLVLTEATVVTPYQAWESFWKKKSFGFFDIFCLFGQHKFINLLKQQNSKKELTNRDIDFYKTQSILNLLMRRSELVFFRKKIQEAERALRRKKSDKGVRNYSNEQKCLYYMNAYLNAFYGIYDCIKNIDDNLNHEHAKKLLGEKWFTFALVIRNAFQHVETPTIYPDDTQGIMLLTFLRLDKLNDIHLKRFPILNAGKFKPIKLRFRYLVIEEALLGFLEEWSEKHLESLTNEEARIIVKLENGKTKTKKISLPELKNQAKQIRKSSKH